MNPHKLRLARLLQVSGISGALLRAQAALWRRHVRAVNYHDIPSSRAAAFEGQLRFYAERFVTVGRDDLLELQAGRWPHARPGLILSFDDGLRSHAEIAAPLLEKYGCTGWFFIPAAFPDVPVERQTAYAREHNITAGETSPAGRLAMTWDEARGLSRRHVVGCHTMNHERLAATLPPERLRVEVGEAKQRLEQRLQRDVDVFCWVGGEEWSYSRAAAQAIRDAGFRIGFMTNSAVIRPGADLLQLQRTNVEVDYPSHLLRFQLSGVVDLMYLPKRRRVDRLTAVDRG